MSIENKVPMSDFTEVTDIADTARIIGLQDNENVKIPLQSLIAKTLDRVDEDILTRQDINVENGVTGFEPIGQVVEGDSRAVSGEEVYEAIDYAFSLQEIDIIKYESRDLNVIDYNRSTFSSWGHKILNANTLVNKIEVYVYQFNADRKIKNVGIRVCKDNYDGDVILKLIKNVENDNIPTNSRYKVSFTFDKIDFSLYDGLWLEVVTDGGCALVVADTGLEKEVRYKTNSGQSLEFMESGGVVAPMNNKLRGLLYELHHLDKVAIPNEDFKDKINSSDKKTYSLLTKHIYAKPTLDVNIYTDNIFIGSDKTSLDIKSNLGAFKSRGYVITTESNRENKVTFTLNDVSYETTIKTADVNNGNGITRKVLLVGDSLVNWGQISTPLFKNFENDVMNIELIGTLGSGNSKHEGRSGWKLSDYMGAGKTLYNVKIENSPTTLTPAVGDVYTQGSVIYTIREINMSGGIGNMSFEQTSGANRPLSNQGVLTKVSGVVDDVITYDSVETTSSNPFYNTVTKKFDFSYYMLNTGQSMSSGDYFLLQIGINDLYNIQSRDLAVTKVDEMIGSFNVIINSIKEYNVGIKIVLSTLLRGASQNAFSVTSKASISADIYNNIVMLEFQNRMINVFDEKIENVILCPTHLNIDTVYNYPETEVQVNSRNTKKILEQSNAVHPSASGYHQLADMYSGVIKYFG